MRPLLVVVCLLAGCAPAFASGRSCLPVRAVEIASSSGVAATVEDAIITDYDLTQSVRLRLAVQNLDPCGGALARIEREELVRLKVEQTWISLARRRDIRVEPAEVDARISALTGGSGISLEAFMARLARAGVVPSSLRREIAAEIARAKFTGKPAAFPYRIAIQ